MNVGIGSHPCCSILRNFQNAAKRGGREPNFRKSGPASRLARKTPAGHAMSSKRSRHWQSIRGGRKRLGSPPDDLFDVLALAASAAPATAALRAFARRRERCHADCLPLLDTAARTGRAFLSLFNHAEVIETVRTEFRGEPYWQRVLEYAHAGGLQAVLDEYAHLLKESLGVAAAPVTEMAEKICCRTYRCAYTSDRIAAGR